ncbi:uncharacterized protein V1510DRAFT_409235 [Dipodascopsis tothii]|uniref:uncharacterized protein n=1 Tax=Dipodascopsis tothii TaxID=44089 RepID=UPI0034CFE821
MSLFGDDYIPRNAFGAAAAAAPSRSAIFGAVENAYQSVAAANDSLFGSDGGDPWSLPAPRSTPKPTISNILDGVTIPPIYADAFEQSEPAGGVVTAAALRAVIDRAGLADGAADRIMNMVIRNKPDNRIDRGTWNTAMTMVGLAQEGEDDFGLDAIDSRRYSLPNLRLRAPPHRHKSVPIVPATAPRPVAKDIANRSLPPQIPAQVPQQAPRAQRQQPQQAPLRQAYMTAPVREAPLATSVPVPISTTSTASVPPTAMTPPSPVSPAGADPWASSPPENDYGSSTFTTNTYSTTTYASNNYSSNSTYATNTYTSNPYGSNGYGSSSRYAAMLGRDYDDMARNSALFDDTPRGGNIAEDDDSEDDDAAQPAVGAGTYADAPVPSFPYTRETPYYDAHEQDKIKVSIIPEKEGVLIFRHVNYLLEGGTAQTADGSAGRGGQRVVRRYSDFVWLLNCLYKRYPFRLLPLLPPKRFAVNGHYLSSDDFFLERRRRGLSRFINELVRHPVLSREQLVVMFLTVPTELVVWRKQASVSVEEEFVGRSIPDGLIESWNERETERWEDVKEGVKQEAEIYTHLCLLIDKMEKRQESVAADHKRFANAMSSLQDATSKTYSSVEGSDNDLTLITDGLKNVSKYLSNAQTLLEDESRGWEIGVLEDFKRHRDNLISVKELFDRKEKLDINQIPYLERRISNNEARLSQIRGRSDIRPSDIERIELAVVRDKETINEQTTRTWLIKECMRDEITYFEQTKYKVAKLFQDYAQERLKYSELFAENWKVLSNEISEVPTSAS